MPPPGDLRNRVLALADRSTQRGKTVSALFRARLSREGTVSELEQQLERFVAEDHPLVASIEPRCRQLILDHLTRFIRLCPNPFDLRGGSIGNFVIAGAYLATGDLDAAVREFSSLVRAKGDVLPVCTGPIYHLKALTPDGEQIIGQSAITAGHHCGIREVLVGEMSSTGAWTEAQPLLNPLVKRAIGRADLITFAMGSFYTSVLPTLLAKGIGQAIRERRCPKVFVANLRLDPETPRITASEMLRELYRYVSRTDPSPGKMSDYVQYAVVGEHGESDADGRVPVDLDRIRELGVRPIVLPLEKRDQQGVLIHDADKVAEILVSLS